MNKGRLEAFSDGVIAILITIMVFDVKAPASSELSAFQPLIPMLLTYALSFLYLGTYWNNHHHLLQATRRVNGLVLWANLHLLFWLSLFPFTTNWLRTGDFASLPCAVYGAVLLFAGMAFQVLQTAILQADPANTGLRDILTHRLKGKVSIAMYALGVATSFLHPWVAIGCYAIVPPLWVIPEPRIEALLDPSRTPAADEEGSREPASPR